MIAPPRSPPDATQLSCPRTSRTSAWRSRAWAARSYTPSAAGPESAKPRRSGTMTSKPARASGSMLRHQIRLVSGQPWTSSSGCPPTPSRTIGEFDAVPHLGSLDARSGLGRGRAGDRSRARAGHYPPPPLMPENRYDPKDIEPRWQQVWADERTWEVPNPVPGVSTGRRGAEVLRARDAALPERRAPHRAPQGLLGGRRGRPLPPPDRTPRPAPHGLRRVRPAGGEPRDQDRPAPARLDGRGDRRVPAPVPDLGHLDRLVARVRHARAALLPLDPVDLQPALPQRARVPQGCGRQVVSRTTRRCSPTNR